MSTLAQRERLAGRSRGRSKPKRAARAAGGRRLLAGGVLWIVLFATLLAGVVAVNVAVLQLNLELDRVARERSQLRADVAGIRSGLSSAAATARIERAAREELGLVPADPESTVYVTLAAK